MSRYGKVLDGKVFGRGDDGSELDDHEFEEEVSEPITKFVRKILKEKEKTDKELERKLRRASNRQNPTGTSIKTRYSLLGKNKQDLATVDTEKANDDLAVLVGKAVANTGKVAVYSHEIATLGTERMYTQDDDLRDDLQGYGRAMSTVLSEILAEIGVQATVMHQELSFKRIARRFKE